MAKLYKAIFSPTGGTDKASGIITPEFGTFKTMDLSKRNADFNPEFEKDDLLLVAVPSFGGRVPAIALERMQKFSGNGAKAILLVTYGNRNYDDTFLELSDFLKGHRFVPVAGIASVTEHSIVRKFATGRPDDNDKKELEDFAKKIHDKLHNNPTEADFPGSSPYKLTGGFPIKPWADDSCVKCGGCARACPVGAIPEGRPDTTDITKCIACMRCISVCPKHARKLDPEKMSVVSAHMQEVCSGHKENVLFL